MEEPRENKVRIIPVPIEEEMRESFFTYAAYVLAHRAIPNVCDGLKPVQRRILVALHQMGLTHDKAYKKTVRAVGETMGKYHPHGDSAIYQALVRMAQPWSMRYPLIDGQGNFGSIDGDLAAAMRYTEGRLERIAEDGLLADLSKEVVVHHPNFDNSLEEPLVLPARLPNLLLNGSSGIAVGMATNMAPHNLKEVVDGIRAYIDNRDITIEDLMHHIKAPDFPTGGIIYGIQGVKQAFKTGKGRVVLRAKAEIEVLPNGKQQIIVSELPYMVNKAAMIEKTASLVQEKSLEGIADIRDESDREGMRIVYDLKKDAIAQVVLNNLYKHTALQSSFSVNNVALVDGKPKVVNLKDLVRHYVDHRHTIVIRRTEAELRQAERQKHLLEGYLVVIQYVDAIVKHIKNAEDSKIAKKVLMENYDLSEIQAKAILEMRLQKLTGLERQKITMQHEELSKLIVHLNNVLADEGKRMKIIKDELAILSKRYQDPRRSVIEHDAETLNVEDMIPNEQMVITFSQQGYIKVTPLSIYRVQRRGGVGSKGVGSKKEDFIDQIIVASAHNYLLLFTEYGKVYWKRVYDLPKGSKTAQGRSVQNFLNIEPGDAVRSILKVESLSDPEYVANHYVTQCTERGMIKKTPLEAFTRPRAKGIKAINFKDNDRLLEAKLTSKNDYILLALQSGKAVCFQQSVVRPTGRTTQGVQGIVLAHPQDKVIGMLSTPSDDQTTILVVSEKGYGKRSLIKDYRRTNRGCKGVITIKITKKTGRLVAIKSVREGDDLIVMNTSGTMLRTAISSLRIVGRATQGVRIVRLRAEDNIASLAIVHASLDKE